MISAKVDKNALLFKLMKSLNKATQNAKIPLVGYLGIGDLKNRLNSGISDYTTFYEYTIKIGDVTYLFFCDFPTYGYFDMNNHLLFTAKKVNSKIVDFDDYVRNNHASKYVIDDFDFLLNLIINHGLFKGL